MAARAGAADGPARADGFNPLRLTWQLLINVKFALFLVGLAAVCSLIGVMVPQLPEEMRGNAAAEAVWLEAQRGTFGVFTDPMYRLDLFTVFRSWWFNGLWIVIIVAVTVCTVSRFRPTARSVHRPQREVPDAYFERARHRADFTHEGGADAVEGLLQRRRYAVERVKERDGDTYLFAERYSWSQYGTFVSHLALLMLLVGGFLTVVAGYQRVIPLSEGRAGAPVFIDPRPDQIFVEMQDAYRGIDEEGNIVDFRSTVEIRQGEEYVGCEITINDPCSAFGHRFYQATYFNDLAALRVDGPDGRVLYDDVLDFNSEVGPVPHVSVRDADGSVVFDQPVAQLGSENSPAGTIATSQVAFRDAETGLPEVVPVFWRNVEGEMAFFVLDGDGSALRLAEGEAFALGEGLELRFEEVVPIPRLRVLDMPGSRTEEGALAQLVEVPDGETLLVINGVDNRPVILSPGDAVETSGGYRFVYDGQLSGAGIDVRRDPGHTFIWIAIAMALVGLSITFYVPRRRLWARVGVDGRTQLAGVAERTTRFGRELRRMGAELGAKDALLAVDEEERY